MRRYPPKHILVACDETVQSAAAWRAARELARAVGARASAVHVRERIPPAEFDAAPPLEPPPGEEARREAALRALIGPDARLFQASGDAAEAILRTAHERRADLIVVGTHGRSGLGRALLGSVAEAVAARSPRPVLVVKGAGGAIRSVLAPVDFTPASARGFAYAAPLAAALGAELTALHVRVDPIWNGRAGEKLRALAASSVPGVRWELDTSDDSPSEGIARAAADRDLVVLTARRRRGLKELILGTTASRVLRSARASVLILPAG